MRNAGCHISRGGGIYVPTTLVRRLCGSGPTKKPSHVTSMALKAPSGWATYYEGTGTSKFTFPELVQMGHATTLFWSWGAANILQLSESNGIR